MTSSSVALDRARDAKSELNAEWEAAAVEIVTAVEARIAAPLKQAAEQLYVEVMAATQDYLADNTLFNIASRLESAERERRLQWKRAEAAEHRSAGLLAALIEARDLLLERTRGSHARSPAHNARLVIDDAIVRVLPAPPHDPPALGDKSREAI